MDGFIGTGFEQQNQKAVHFRSEVGLARPTSEVRPRTKFTIRTVDLQIDPPEFTPDDVRRVRNALVASQAVFAKLLGVSVKTVQAWEQGHEPSSMARRLLDVIEQDLEPWRKLLDDAFARRSSDPRTAAPTVTVQSDSIAAS